MKAMSPTLLQASANDLSLSICHPDEPEKKRVGRLPDTVPGLQWGRNIAFPPKRVPSLQLHEQSPDLHTGWKEKPREGRMIQWGRYPEITAGKATRDGKSGQRQDQVEEPAPQRTLDREQSSGLFAKCSAKCPDIHFCERTGRDCL